MPRNKAISTLPKKHRKKRAALIVIVLLGALIAVLWIQRYALIERYARYKIAQMGYDAKFSITDISGKQVKIEDIHLSRNGEGFFTADTVSAAYNWREALNGHLITLNFDRPTLEIAVDDEGRIASDWMPKSSGGSPPPFPAQGVTIREGKINLQSPYGPFTAFVVGEATGMETATLSIAAEPQTFTLGETNAKFGAVIDATLSGNMISTQINLVMMHVQKGDLSAENLYVSGTLDTAKADWHEAIDMDFKAGFGALNTPDVSTGNGNFSWTGRLSLTDTDGSYSFASRNKAKGDWAIKASNVRIKNPNALDSLARTLTLSETLANISSSEPFAPGLSQNAAQFLTALNVEASGSLLQDDTQTHIELKQPVVMKGETETLSLAPQEGRPFYRYNPQNAVHRAAFNADYSGPYGLTITEGDVRASSEEGFTLEHFSGRIKTKRTWQARTPARRPARLAPLSANVTYDAVQDTRTVSASGAINFDGDVPGGYGQGLKARGTLGLKLKGESLTARFRAAKNNPIKVTRLETSSDWIIQDGTFHLANKDLVYDRKISRRVTTQLASGTGQLLNSLDGRDLNFSFAKTDVSGQLSDPRQDWMIDANTVHITSDTFPSPGTDIRAPAAKITASLIPDHPIEFTIDSPVTSVQTELVKAANLSVKAKGSTEDLYVSYDQGLIKFSAGELPVLPLEGDVRYKDSAWAGDAVTYLPGAKLSPIDVAYTFKDGEGAADVTITDLPFKPGKLQPKHILPAMTGMVSRVDGLVSSGIHIEFGTGKPLTSSGTAEIKNMHTGTLPGPIRGMNATLSFSSLFPVATNGSQTLTIESFDPGLPLKDGVVTFEVITDGIKIHSAKWPLGSGSISLEPTIWLYSSPKNSVVLAIENVSLGEFLNDMGGGKLSASGNVNGRLPVVIEGINVRVENGRLAVKNGGIIQYTSPQTNLAAESNEYAGYAFDALKNFEYEELEAELNGALDGPMTLRLVFNGANPDVLYGTEFKFNIGVEGELLNILRSFQNGNGVSSAILDQIKATSTKPQTLSKTDSQ